MKKREKKERKKRVHGKVYHVLMTIISAVLILVMGAGLVVINQPQGLVKQNSHMLNSIMGGVKNTVSNPSGVKDEDAQYYEAEDAQKLQKDAAALQQALTDQGTVLLKNENGALPLARGTKLSFFSANAVPKSGSGMMAMFGGSAVSLKDAAKKAGFKVNGKLWKFYEEGDGKDYGLAAGSVSFGDAEDFAINEAPLSALKKAGVLDSAKGTTPVFVLSRVAGEGRDMPRSMYSHAKSQEDKEKSYLEPDSTELEILQYLNDNFDNVVLVVDSNAALDLGFLKDFPQVRSVLFSPKSTASVPRILSGEVNPSGRTVDTFATNALESAAAQNFGDYQYSDESGKLTKYNYVSYKEGIYVGYRYYETRYEDAVLGQGNAGDYRYQEAVQYPFGYGLSYTSFDWSDFSLDWKDQYTAEVSVTVKNTGSAAGREVVEFYAQSPYTDYDRAHGIEKSAVQLVAYGKTKELAPGESERVSATVEKEQLKAFDRSSGSYVFDAGTYYFTAAANAHAAENQILAQRGSKAEKLVNAAGMSSGVSADKSLVREYKPGNTDTDVTTYANDTATGAKISAQLGFAQGDLTYLTRKDWTGTFPTHDGEASSQISTWGNEINGTDKKGKAASYTYTKTATDEELAQLDSLDARAEEDLGKDQKVTFGADNGLKLSEMRGLSFDDPKWSELLDQMTEKEYRDLVMNSGYGVSAIPSVGMGFLIDADTASGLIYGGTGVRFANPMTLAQTWNQELAKEYGTLIGRDATAGGATGWYAPSMDIHRTPFSGRNGEYYSEDPYVSGTNARLEVQGAASRGLYAYIKHFAFNDQEDHRGDRQGQYSVATWLNEQAAREIYLKPFEMAVKAGTMPVKVLEKTGEGKYEKKTGTVPVTLGVMTAFNRIGTTWTGGCYPLITNILRREWGFNGMIITDNANTGVFMSAKQMLQAGADTKLTYFGSASPAEWDEETQKLARNAAHHVLYVAANTKAMNGVAPGGEVKTTLMTNQVTLIINIVFTLLIALIVFLNVRRIRGARRAKEEAAKQ